MNFDLITAGGSLFYFRTGETFVASVEKLSASSQNWQDIVKVSTSVQLQKKRMTRNCSVKIYFLNLTSLHKTVNVL